MKKNQLESPKFLKLCEILVDSEGKPIIKWVIPTDCHTKRIPPTE